jgi:hypothetical protein
LTLNKFVKRVLKDRCITRELILDSREWKLAIYVIEYWSLISSFYCLFVKKKSHPFSLFDLTFYCIFLFFVLLYFLIFLFDFLSSIVFSLLFFALVLSYFFTLVWFHVYPTSTYLGIKDLCWLVLCSYLGCSVM